MFTSIQKLRASHAQQQRVTTVANWLKRNDPNLKEDAAFPIFVIGNSNAAADVDWVFYAPSTHINDAILEKAILAEFGHKSKSEHQSFILDGVNSGKVRFINECNPKYAAAYAKAGRTVPSIFGKIEPSATAPAIANGAAAKEAISSLDVVNGSVGETKTETPATEAPAKAAATPTAAPETSNLYRALMYIALGQVMQEKDKTFEEAVSWSLSPTGSRRFSEYVEANEGDARCVREELRKFAAEQKA